MALRDDQTDVCHKSGSCGAGCPACAAKFEINFHPGGAPLQSKNESDDSTNNSAG